MQDSRNGSDFPWVRTPCWTEWPVGSEYMVVMDLVVMDLVVKDLVVMDLALRA